MCLCESLSLCVCVRVSVCVCVCLCECVCVCVCVCECDCVCACVLAVCVKADLCIQTSARHLAEDSIQSDLNFLPFGSRVIKGDEFSRGDGRVLLLRSRWDYGLLLSHDYR